MAIKIRNSLDPSIDEGITFEAQGRTKQSFKDECDVNQILKKFETTGLLPGLIKENPQYGDFSSVPDYQSALNLVRMADAQFSALDAKVRARFGNDPEQFLAFTADPANAQEMVKLGLAKVAKVVRMPDGESGPKSPSKAVKKPSPPASSSSGGADGQ